MALKGLKVIEIAGLAPGPFCGMLLSDFGANVVRIERPGQAPLDSLKRGKRSATIDLKHEIGKGIFQRLCSNADVLIEPFRPGVMERLGLGPDRMLELNKRLIYARLSGFGQSGKHSLKAGHDINYLALSGVLSLFGANSCGKPVPPVNMLADFAGGGATCAIGILVALIERSKSGLGQTVDVSMVEGTRYVSSYMWHTRKEDALASDFIWPNKHKKAENLLDGGAPFYTCYATGDSRWISVGAIEPQFYSSLLKVLNLDENLFEQFDHQKWAHYKDEFARVFATKTLAEWTKLFDATDSCVEPVLELDETEAYCRTNELLRDAFNEDGTPQPAPLLGRTPARPKLVEAAQGEHTAEVLQELGYSAAQIAEWASSKVIECNIERSKL